ncbi:hypothetical protein [Glutamicibacter sp. NPDC087583]|uniref:hypothetical protein n=1 Tax=Glutamicibacter sp. NPDC087583 TaxID=3363995 RepID=UPI0038098BDF
MESPVRSGPWVTIGDLAEEEVMAREHWYIHFCFPPTIGNLHPMEFYERYYGENTSALADVVASN